MIRELVAADLSPVRRRAEQLAVEYYPEMLPDIDRMHDLLNSLRQDPTQYTRVIGDVAKPAAALIAKAGGNLWAARRHATILLWYSDRPGAGFHLLRDFRQWTVDQRSITLAGLMDDFGLAPRLGAFLVEEKFVQRGGAYVFFPRGAKK